MAEKKNERFRQLQGFSSVVWKIGLLLIPISGVLYILGIHQKLGFSVFKEQYSGLFLGLVLAGIFIGVPSSKNEDGTKVPWYDWIMALMGLFAGLFIAVYYPVIVNYFGYVTPDRVVISIMAILLILEALRRTFGWSLVCVVGVFLIYAFFPSIFPGPLQGERSAIDDLFNYLYLDTNSLLYMLNIAATVALAFILFGQILLKFGGGDIFNDLAFSFFGKFRGGPAKASVAGSSLAGSISGGPVSNVMLTGSMTIPLMIRNGYTRKQAGAIESVASTGGMIMPPVMGIAAFIIAENLGVPYGEVVIAGIIPAVLYYLCVFVQVDLKAAKQGIYGIDKSDLPNAKEILKIGWIIIPIFGALLYFLFVVGYSPTTSGVYAAVVAIPFLLIQRSVWKSVGNRLMNALLGTGQSLLDIGIILAAAGIVTGIVSITGLGFNLALALTQIGETNLLLLLITSAAVCIILGMGMPAVAAYALVATLIAPALVELGIHPMAAHLFVFYFANMSSFTPPIAVASFAAATIAKENPYKIGFSAMAFGVVGLIVPFVFVYSPHLLLGVGENNIGTAMIMNFAAILGFIMLSISFVGYLFNDLKVGTRLLFAVAAFLLLFPINQGFAFLWSLKGIGLILSAALVFWEIKFKHKSGENKTFYSSETMKSL
ncbi:TRAP transporter permease [Lentibacillus halophilus]|uniref:TRAP transporter permease n=1 Tax=Lentibacillus halophilus TaxID=295065 RepID=A0ABN0Z9I4_9BACI